MPEQAHDIIRQWQQRWARQSLLVSLLPLLALALVLICVAVKIMQLSWWWLLPVVAVAFAAGWFRYRSRQVKIPQVIRYLDQHYPQLEESSGLLLKPAAKLNLLEQLQVQQTEQALLSLDQPHPFQQKLKAAWLMLASALLCCIIITVFVHYTPTQPAVATATGTTSPSPEKILPAIKEINLTIEPPAYTGKSSRNQHQFNIEAEEGALVKWQIHTNRSLPTLKLVFNDSTVVSLQAKNNAHTSWEAAKTISRAGFYQVQLQQELSELYRIEAIRDQPPAVTVQSPKPYTTIDYGEPQQLTLKLTISDDYGISDAFINTTIASGSGEAVKFKEQQIRFDQSFSDHPRNSDLSKTIHLAPLGMKPGDELYFYITATDNHQQQTRSDVLIVSLADTAQLMSMDGLVNGINLKPEYFRSQRQIIIETEQLIRNKDTISAQRFKDKSNGLGIDQKLLRLRYGKFLGEEAESNIGDPRLEADEHDHAPAHADDPAHDVGNAAKILDQFTDKHDNAEDASFFEPETKKQLKATLTEMWNAELRLRLFKPQEALPYEYKALRLLKDLQQKSRAYVAKTGIKTTPLKPEKRLSGDLSKITSPLTQRQYASTDAGTVQLRKALGMLEQLKTGQPSVDAAGMALLQSARQSLATKAAAAPAQYLSSLEAINRIARAVQQKQSPGLTDITLAQHGLYLLLAPPPGLPAAASAPADNQLYQQYFQQLKQHSQRP